MAFFHFPYRTYTARSLNGAERDELRPTIDVTVSIGDEFYSRDMLVDTGAPLSILQHNVGVALGVDFDSPDADVEQALMFGEQFNIQRETVTLEVHCDGELKWTTDVWFIVEEDIEWTVQVGGVLGGEGFFDTWAVTFVRAENYFVIEEYDTLAKRVPPLDLTQKILDEHDNDWWRTGI